MEPGGGSLLKNRVTTKPDTGRSFQTKEDLM